jgi:hypothetical protein
MRSLAEVAPTPWAGIAAIAAMVLLPVLLAWWSRAEQAAIARAGRRRRSRGRPDGVTWRTLLWQPGGPHPGGQTRQRPPASRRQRRIDAGPGLGGPGRSTLMPRPARAYSDFYEAYIRGGARSPLSGRTWQETREHLLNLNVQTHGGACQLGIVCGGLHAATQLDHCAKVAGYAHDYARLGQEGPDDCRPVCRGCHVRRTQLQRQGVDAWAWKASRA